MKPGFTLLESLVYLLLTTLIAGLSLHIGALFYHTIAMHLEDSSVEVLSLLALQSFKKDIQRACKEEASWKCIKGSMIVFSDGVTDYGWAHEDGCLLRYQGVFRIKAQNWKRSTKSKVLSQVCSVRFKVYKQEYIQGVEIELLLKDSSIPLHLFLAVKAESL